MEYRRSIQGRVEGESINHQYKWFSLSRISLSGIFEIVRMKVIFRGRENETHLYLSGLMMMMGSTFIIREQTLNESKRASRSLRSFRR